MKKTRNLTFEKFYIKWDGETAAEHGIKKHPTLGKTIAAYCFLRGCMREVTGSRGWPQHSNPALKKSSMLDRS